MPIYNVNGESLDSLYNVNGESLNAAYNVNGELIWTKDNPDALRVMTYNVQKFTGINAQQAMQNLIISTYDADIIGIQETGGNVMPTVGANALAGYENIFIGGAENSANPPSLASKLALQNPTAVQFQAQDPYDWDNWSERRMYQKADLSINGKTVTWINTHLCLYYPYLESQMGEIFAAAQQCEYVIITGDFNSGTSGIDSTSYTRLYKQFVDAGYNLANNSPDSGWHNTYTSSAAATSLAELSTPPDSIIVSGNIDIENVIFDTTKFSYLNGSPIDHIAVIADLVIN